MNSNLNNSNPLWAILGSRISQTVAVLSLCSLAFLNGCGDGRPPLAPVKGTVTYKGKALEFGSVMFLPERGQAAKGTINPDGSFELSTYDPGDGAAIGTHKVRVTCYESQNPNAQNNSDQEIQLGESRIPEKFTTFDASGITQEVKTDNGSITIELKD